MKKIFIIIVIIIIALIGILALGKYIYKIEYKNRIAEVSADDVEIERKWLINKDNIKYDLSTAKVYEIEQTYINFSPEIRVRRVNGSQYSFTLKKNMSDNGLIRDEVDFLITEDEYNELISKKVENTIFKTRYKLLDQGFVVTIDIFKGELEGLAYMEIEFANKEEAETYQTPEWVIKDVTDDIRYKNASLAKYGIPND